MREGCQWASVLNRDYYSRRTREAFVSDLLPKFHCRFCLSGSAVAARRTTSSLDRRRTRSRKRRSVPWKDFVFIRRAACIADASLERHGGISNARNAMR